jgi:hypothetical protein
MGTATDEISLVVAISKRYSRFDVGTKLNLFSISGERVLASGILATKYPQVGNGIGFVETTAEDRLKLNSFIFGTCGRESER